MAKLCLPDCSAFDPDLRVSFLKVTLLSQLLTPFLLTSCSGLPEYYLYVIPWDVRMRGGSARYGTSVLWWMHSRLLDVAMLRNVAYKVFCLWNWEDSVETLWFVYCAFNFVVSNVMWTLSVIFLCPEVHLTKIFLSRLIMVGLLVFLLILEIISPRFSKLKKFICNFYFLGILSTCSWLCYWPLGSRLGCIATLNYKQEEDQSKYIVMLFLGYLHLLKNPNYV